MTTENVDFLVAQDGAVNPRKPRIALMGEFSAGKSTLANLLCGKGRLPVQVTATQVPPVWIVKGEAAPYRVDLAGRSIAQSLAHLADAPLHDTVYVRIALDVPILDLCDLIDIPGISDPNMPTDVWQRLLPEVDSIIWCSHATQAWRQSEAAVWATIPDAIRASSLLLLTRIDKIVDPRDRARILRRVATETAGQFACDPLPVSLTRAVAGKNDPALWAESGAAAMMRAIESIVRSPAHAGPSAGGAVVSMPAPPPRPAEAAGTGPQAEMPATPVVPRRVRLDLGAGAGVRRPPPDDPKVSAFRTMMRDRQGR